MLEKYKWDKRLVVHYRDNSDEHQNIQKYINDFFKKNQKDTHERKVESIELFESKVAGNLAFAITENGYGIYLIGLDGSIKKYSQNTDIIDNLFNIIDAMPMRRRHLNQ